VSDRSKIFIGQVSDISWIRVDGRGSVQNSAALKDCALALTEQGTSNFVIDLENCGGMDSTFIGTLAGIALRVQGLSGSVGLVNASARNLQLICSLGLDEIFEIDESGLRWEAERNLVASGLQEIEDHATREEKSEASLEAHEALGVANEDNLPRFKDVVEYLRQDLGSSE